LEGRHLCRSAKGTVVSISQAEAVGLEPTSE